MNPLETTSETADAPLLALGAHVLGQVAKRRGESLWIADAWERAAELAQADERKGFRSSGRGRLETVASARAARAGQAVRDCLESHRLVVTSSGSGHLAASFQRERCERRGCPSCEARNRRRGISRYLPRAEAAAAERKAGFFSLTHQDRPGESLTDARARFMTSWSKFSRTPAFRESVSGGVIADDRTWSTEDRRRRVKAQRGRLEPRDGRGSWWHFHAHGIIEQTRGRVRHAPDGDEHRDELETAARLESIGRPRSHAAAFLEAAESHSIQDIAEGLFSTPFDNDSARMFRRLHHATKWVRARFLRTAAADCGLNWYLESISMRASRENRSTRSAVLETMKYSSARAAVLELDRMAECLLVNTGAQVQRCFGSWKACEDAEPADALEAEAEPGDEPEETADVDQEEAERRSVVLARFSLEPVGPIDPLLAASLVLAAEASRGRRARWAEDIAKKHDFDRVLKYSHELLTAHHWADLDWIHKGA